MTSVNYIGKAAKLLLICFLLLTPLLLSSCESRWQYNANLYRIQDFSRAMKEDFEDLSITDVGIDDEEKNFSMTCAGPETIAEFDQIRETINDYLAGNPDYFLNDGYSITISFFVYNGRLTSGIGMITNRKYPYDEKNDDLYENLACMEISNGYEGTYEISQLEGHCTTLKAIALNGVPLNDVDVLKNLPELESVELISGYSNSEYYQLKLALPECEVTSVRQSA